MKHTPGPWEVRKDGHVWHPTHPMLLEGRICLLVDPKHPSAKADAQLIAAAPELLEVCKELVDPPDPDWYCAKCGDYLDGSRVTYDEACDTCGYPVTVGNPQRAVDKARAAIAKAE